MTAWRRVAAGLAYTAAVFVVGCLLLAIVVAGIGPVWR